MPESLVQVNEGSGKKFHTISRTIGANTVEDEVVILGIPFLAEYRGVNGTTYASFATADSHIVQLMAGGTLNVYVHRIRIYQHAVATAAAFGTAQVVRLTSAGTGGSAFTPNPLDPTDAASGAAMMTLPTVKGAEAATVDEAEAYFIQTIGASQSGGLTPLLYDFDFRGPRQKMLRIPAGAANGVCVKLRTAIAAANGVAVVEFSEANY